MIILTKDGKPFEGEPNMAIGKVMQAVSSGVWDEKELADRGLFLCTPFEAPVGKQAVGDPRYVQDKTGTWQQEYDVQDAVIVPQAIPTPAEMFELKTGITIAQLKELLA